MHKILAALAMALVAGAAAAQSVDFTEPKNGAVVSSPFKVKFAVTGMEVKPAGTMDSNTGHHHLLIDTDLPPAGKEIPSDRNHLHFGAGETETMLELPPGKHTLQLLMGDENHVPHTPPVKSPKITITVK